MSNRLPTVEALRAFGAISVLWMHCIWLGPWDFPRGLGAWFHHGWLGVDLFLIISGFATTRALFQGQSSAQTQPLRKPLRCRCVLLGLSQSASAASIKSLSTVEFIKGQGRGSSMRLGVICETDDLGGRVGTW